MLENKGFRAPAAREQAREVMVGKMGKVEKVGRVQRTNEPPMHTDGHR